MRILIQSINFAPELTGIGKYTGELAEWLVSRGHDVTVVTAVPYYPQWSVAAGYRAWRWTRERHAGALVIRCPLWVPSRPSGLKRLLHLVSFALSSLPVMIAQAAGRPDVVLVVEPPLVCAPVAAMTALLAGGKSWLHVQDFEVDAAFSLGVLHGGLPSRLALRIERFLMARFSRVSTISPQMVERLAEKGVDEACTLLFSNWIDGDVIFPLPTSPLRAELGFREDAIVALYSGTMNKKQGLSLLAEAAQRLPNISFVFCGEGLERARLIEATTGCGNVRFLPLQPLDRLNSLMNLADIHLLPQLPGAADLVMPSKLQGMFASGRPVIATADPETQLGKTVRDCGLLVPPGDLEAFVSALEELSSDRARRLELGINAREHAMQNWGKEKVLLEFEAQLIMTQQPLPEEMKL